MLNPFVPTRMTYQNPDIPKPVPNVDSDKMTRAIRAAETGGVKGNPYPTYQYSGRQDLGNANGAYRVTDGELKTYAPRLLKQSVTPQQFRNDPTLQDSYVGLKSTWLGQQGLTPEQILAVHNWGIPTDPKTQQFDFSPQRLQSIVNNVNRVNPNYISTGMAAFNQPAPAPQLSSKQGLSLPIGQ